jgi:hypothetical protein
MNVRRRYLVPHQDPEMDAERLEKVHKAREDHPDSVTIQVKLSACFPCR